MWPVSFRAEGNCPEQQRTAWPRGLPFLPSILCRAQNKQAKNTEHADPQLAPVYQPSILEVNTGLWPTPSNFKIWRNTQNRLLRSRPCPHSSFSGYSPPAFLSPMSHSDQGLVKGQGRTRKHRARTAGKQKEQLPNWRSSGVKEQGIWSDERGWQRPPNLVLVDEACLSSVASVGLVKQSL